MTRKLLWMAALGFAVYILWPYGVFQLYDHNPKTTALIERRRMEAGAVHRKFDPAMTWMPLKSISPNLVHAVLLAEDDTFYKHHGFDLEQIWIAWQEDWQKGRYAYG